MLLVLAVFGVAAIILPALVRVLGRRVFLLAGLVSFGAFVHTLLQAPAILDGDPEAYPIERLEWVTQLQLSQKKIYQFLHGKEKQKKSIGGV